MNGLVTLGIGEMLKNRNFILESKMTQHIQNKTTR